MTSETILTAEAFVPLSERGPASPRVVVGFGFWLYLISDIVIFGALFAAYAVLSSATDGGPTGMQLFDRGHVFGETLCLLASSISCGFMAIEIERRNVLGTYAWAAVTFALGSLFLGLELSEFGAMIASGAGPQRSAFLSAFFTLVGCHGLHVTAGLLWLLTMMAQVFAKGYRPDILRRMLCFSLFWHALDIIWVALFSMVYLMGVAT